MNTHLYATAVSVLADHGDYGHPWPYFWIFPVLFWIGLISFGFLFRRGCRRGSGIGTLRSSFARGEISEEDYLTRLEVLRRSRRRF